MAFLLNKLSPLLSTPKLNAPSPNFSLFKMTHGSLIFPSLNQVLSPELEFRRCKTAPKLQIISSFHLPGIQERESHTPDKTGELTPLIIYFSPYILKDGVFLEYWAIKHLVPHMWTLLKSLFSVLALWYPPSAPQQHLSQGSQVKVLSKPLIKAPKSLCCCLLSILLCASSSITSSPQFGAFRNSSL